MSANSQPEAIFSSGDEVVVAVAVAPGREEPAHRAQRVTEFVLGEVLRVLEDGDGWVRVRGADGYEAWTVAGPLCAGAAAWRAEAALYSLGAALPGPGTLGRLPWGARVCPSPGGARLPRGDAVILADANRLIEVPTFTPTAGSPGVDRLTVLRDRALDWLGAPYVWGGRTELGVDCSGFTQALFASVGMALPRDSHQQADVGAEVDPPELGDLIFFAPEGGGITHVALAIDRTTIVHSSSTNGCVAVDDLTGGKPLARRLADSVTKSVRPL